MKEKTPTKKHVHVVSGRGVRVQRLSETVRTRSRLVEKTGPLSVYAVPLVEEETNVHGCRRFRFGENSGKAKRSVLLVGASGSGKSTLINAMINYILGVEWDDPYRFKLVDEDQSRPAGESQTPQVTVYQVNHQEGFKVHYSLTLVDTPGFGDSRGPEREQEVTEQLRNLFSAQLGVTHIDALCFVAQASPARPAPSLKRLFESLLSIFGRDVEENVRVVETFSDVPLPHTDDEQPLHFRFSSSALFAANQSSDLTGDDKDVRMNENFWTSDERSLERFFCSLAAVETKTPAPVEDVNGEWRRLLKSAQILRRKERYWLEKRWLVKEMKELVEILGDKIRRNNFFQQESSNQSELEFKVSGSGIRLNDCRQCRHVCHSLCRRAGLRTCSAMKDGLCQTCRCCWDQHQDQVYKWEYQEVSERATVKRRREIFLKYVEAKERGQALILDLEQKHQRALDEVEEQERGHARSLDKLRSTKSWTSPEKMDLLMEEEQHLQALKETKEKAMGEEDLQSPAADRNTETYLRQMLSMF